MITFYSMEGCGYCKKALAELKEEIAFGQVVVKNASDAPSGVRGFPYFTSSSGATHTGYLPKDQLFEKLGENIKHPHKEPHHPPQHPHKPPQHPPQHPHKPPQHPPHHPHHPHKPPHQEPEICSKRSGGYVTLGETWIKQKSYIA